MSEVELWKCPRCGRRFANRNQSHSCGPYSVEGFLEGKDPVARALFARFVRLVRRCGPFEFAPAKTRVGFQVRMIFAAVDGLSDRGLRAHVCLRRRLDSPRFTRVDRPSKACFVHYFRAASEEELDGEVLSWLRESYQMGARERAR